MKNHISRNVVLISLCTILLILAGTGGSVLESYAASPVLDIPPDPPSVTRDSIIGPDRTCLGDIVTYTTHFPLGCVCHWTLDGVAQPDSLCELQVNWDELGEHTLSLYYTCLGGITTPTRYLDVIVSDFPNTPLPIEGDTAICEFTIHSYTTTVGPYDSCEWTVDGLIQPSISPTMTFSFGGAGTYEITVKAYNQCGISSYESMTVTAAGLAPATPSPIQGADEACEGDNETYTTTIGQGETCQWKIDGVVQATTSTTLNVDWEAGQHVLEARALTDCGTGNPVYLDVDVGFYPDIDLGNDTTIYQGQSLTLDAGNPGAIFEWNTGATTQSITVVSAGTYNVSATTECGSDFDEIDVNVIVGIGEQFPEPEVVIYAWDDYLRIEKPAMPVKEVKVFSADGKIIYLGPYRQLIRLPAPGLYIAIVITTEGTVRRKVISY